MALIICPECGNQVSDKAQVCPHCGISIAKISSVHHQSTNGEERQIVNKSPKTWLMALIITIAIFALLAICLFAFSGRYSGKESESQSGNSEISLNSVSNEGDKYVVIDGSQLRLRLTPSTDGETFKWKDGSNRHPKKGEKFRYLGETDSFYQIDFHGNRLWVSKDYAHLDCIILDNQRGKSNNAVDIKKANNNQNVEKAITISDLLLIVSPEKEYSVGDLLKMFNQWNLPLVMKQEYNAGLDWNTNSAATSLCWGRNVRFDNKLIATGTPCLGIELNHFTTGWTTQNVPRVSLITDDKTIIDRLIKEARIVGFNIDEQTEIPSYMSSYGAGEGCYKVIDEFQSYYLQRFDNKGHYVIEISIDNGVDL